MSVRLRACCWRLGRARSRNLGIKMLPDRVQHDRQAPQWYLTEAEKLSNTVAKVKF